MQLRDIANKKIKAIIKVVNIVKCGHYWRILILGLNPLPNINSRLFIIFV